MMNESETPRPLTAFLLYAAITLYATMSSSLLVTWGMPYDVPGGNFLLKIHPGTYVLALAYLAALAPNPVTAVVSDLVRYPAWLFYGLTTVLLIAYSAVMFGTSEAAYIPETLLAPLVLAGVMLRVPAVTRARVFQWTIALLAVNAVIAIGEGLLQTHLVPYVISGKLSADPVFRATALGGHPLTNALATTTFMFASTLLLHRQKLVSVLLIILFTLALLAFGGRVAFVVSVVVGGLWMLTYLGRMMSDPEASAARKLGAVILAIAVLATGISLVIASGLGGRIFEGFRMDSSARSRIALFDVFSLVDELELLFGVGPQGIEHLMRTLRFTSGLTSTIENFWVLWIVNFGLVGFLALTVTLFWFFRSLLRDAPTEIILTALVFLITASGNVSLATKNKGLAFLVVAIIGGSAYAAQVRRREREAAGPSTVHRAGIPVVVLMAIFAGALMLASPSFAADAPVPTLKRGVNLSHWLQYGGRQPVTARDLAAVRAQGFDHVRIPFDPAQFGWQADVGGTAEAKWDRLDRALFLALEADLTVILDLHPKDDLKATIERNAKAQAAYIALWQEFARRYRDVPADRLVFEVLNEPDFERQGATAANDLKRRVVGAIRAVDPTRFLILASMSADRIIDQLEANEIFRDGRLLYVFHFYSPHIFTHFGATWGSYSRLPYTLIKTIRYPSARMDRTAFAVLEGSDRERALRLIRTYVETNWNAERLEREVAEIAAWAQRKGVRVICTEFGVLRTHVDAESRLNWLRDARTALERHGIPWTVWDYADVFGIATASGNIRTYNDGAVGPLDRSDTRRQFDRRVLQALGVKP